MKRLMYNNSRGFTKKDHSANVARIVFVKYTIGSNVELNFFVKDLAKISQGLVK